jgi:hypothetical protein
VLDKINPYVTFQQALQSALFIVLYRSPLTITVFTAFQNQNSALYQAATTMLTVERQTVLMEVVTMASQTDHV